MRIGPGSELLRLGILSVEPLATLLCRVLFRIIRAAPYRLDGFFWIDNLVDQQQLDQSG